MAIADDIVVMNAGRIEDHGAPEAIYLRPASLFSASFMGETNVVSGTVVEAREDALRVDTPLGALALPAACATGGAVRGGDAVGVCFRPEHVLVGDAIGPEAVRFEARLVDAAFFGTHRRARLALGEGDAVEALAHLPQRWAAEAGAAFPVAVERAAFVVLPGAR